MDNGYSQGRLPRRPTEEEIELARIVRNRTGLEVTGSDIQGKTEAVQDALHQYDTEIRRVYDQTQSLLSDLHRARLQEGRYEVLRAGQPTPEPLRDGEYIMSAAVWDKATQQDIRKITRIWIGDNNELEKLWLERHALENGLTFALRDILCE